MRSAMQRLNGTTAAAAASAATTSALIRRASACSQAPRRPVQLLTPVSATCRRCDCHSTLARPFSADAAAPVADAATAAVSSAAASATTTVIPFLPPSEAVRGHFRLKLFRHTWGVEGDLLEFFRAAARDGKAYEGYEAPLAFLSPEQQQQLQTARKELGLEWSALIFTDLTGKRRSVAEHFAEFVVQVQLALEHNPSQMNCHSGMDSWSYAESLDFFSQATSYTKRAVPAGVSVYHETHRGRALYNPWVCRDLVQALPDLMLTADYSHWVNVCERLIDSEADVLRLIAPRVGHIHARVGFEQGPQVSDPRAPEWSGHVAAHERWWEEIFRARERLPGVGQITLVPEYGPGDAFNHYQPKMPYTQTPLADVAQICDWSAARMQRKFRDGTGAPTPAGAVPGSLLSGAAQSEAFSAVGAGNGGRALHLLSLTAPLSGPRRGRPLFDSVVFVEAVDTGRLALARDILAQSVPFASLGDLGESLLQTVRAPPSAESALLVDQLLSALRALGPKDCEEFARGDYCKGVYATAASQAPAGDFDESDEEEEAGAAEAAPTSEAAAPAKRVKLSVRRSILAFMTEFGGNPYN